MVSFRVILEACPTLSPPIEELDRWRRDNPVLRGEWVNDRLPFQKDIVVSRADLCPQGEGIAMGVT